MAFGKRIPMSDNITTVRDNGLIYVMRGCRTLGVVMSDKQAAEVIACHTSRAPKSGREIVARFRSGLKFR